MRVRHSKLAFASDTQCAVVAALRVADVAVVVLSGLLAFWIRHGAGPLPEPYIVTFAIATVLAANYFHLGGLYDFAGLRRYNIQLLTIVLAWGAVAVSLLALAYFTQSSLVFSRVWGALWFMIALGGLVAVRVAVIMRIQRWVRDGRLARNVVVVGAGEYGHRLVRYLKRDQGAGIRILGVFDNRTTRIPRQVEGYPVLGTVDDLLQFVRRNRVDDILIALPWRAGRHLQSLLDKLKTVAADVKLCPDAIAFEVPNLGYSDVAGVPMLKVFERPVNGWNTLTKALEDRVLAALLLVFFSPAIALIALLVRLDSRGPVFFRQVRYGFNNEEISVLKFRTMHAEHGGEAPLQARRNDPRVTPFGAFLRRTSLDELPQLFNVLSGEMSLVGPRPHAVAHNVHYADLIDDYLGRHRVKPGITGWAQVNGLRGETREPDLMRRRVQHDLFYIDNWSILFDLKILFLTAFVGFVHKNAY